MIRTDASDDNAEGAAAQLTPPGSEASIIFGDGITSAEPGSVEALQPTVFDIDAARVDLAADYGSFAPFSDPDGNGWLLQEIKLRLPGRVSGMGTRYDGASDLSQALQRAATAHGEHEARTDEADPDWPDWYADYMLRERAGEELPV